MAGKRDSGGTKAGDNRKARLAEQLRANLLRRKSQARSRRAGDADRRPDGLEQQAPDARDDGKR